LRGLVQVRSILSNIRCIVLPEQKAFSRAHTIFDDHGEPKKPDDRAAIDRVVGALVEVLEKLHGD
jgi:hypothetical protein